MKEYKVDNVHLIPVEIDWFGDRCLGMVFAPHNSIIADTLLDGYPCGYHDAGEIRPIPSKSKAVATNIRTALEQAAMLLSFTDKAKPN